MYRKGLYLGTNLKDDALVIADVHDNGFDDIRAG